MPIARTSVDWNDGLSQDLQDPAFTRDFIVAALDEGIPLQVALAKVFRARDAAFTFPFRGKALERHLALMTLGILRSLQDSTMNLKQAREDLFNLGTFLKIKRLHLSRRVHELFEWAMELE